MAHVKNPNISEDLRRRRREANARWMAKKKAKEALEGGLQPINLMTYPKEAYKALQEQNTLLTKQKEEYIKIIENYKAQYLQLESAYKAERARNVNNYNYISDAIRHCFISVNRAIDDVLPKQGGNQ